MYVVPRPKAGNSRVAVQLSTAEIKRYQNATSGTSGHRANGYDRLAGYDFLLVFCSVLRFR